MGALLLLALSLCSCGGGSSEAAASKTNSIVEHHDQSFVEWTRQSGYPIESLSPGDEFGGLESLGDIVGYARIIAVGEPVHGAREITLIKRRMFEYLVREKGVRTLVAEVGWAEALAVDEYLRTGAGKPDEVLAGLRTWTWNTTDALDFMRWMRRYNESLPPSRQLRFFGADMVYTSASAQALHAYLEGVDQEFLQRVDASLSHFSSPESNEKYARIRSREGGSLQLDVERALDRLWRRRRVYADATSQDAWAIAEHHGQVLRQAVDFWRGTGRSSSRALLRERYMAENVRWLLDRDETGGRVFLWSHNSRVSVEALQDGERMGRQLQRMFGSDLVVIGVLFNRGTFLARNVGRSVAEVEIGPAPEGSVERSLAKVGHEMLIVDLRRATTLVDEWLLSTKLMRETGPRFSDPNSMTYSRILGRRFDALVWVDTTTASTVTSAWRKSAAARGDDAG
jgi:erythromycin esterase